MRTKTYIVHAGNYYVAGTTIPNGWTQDRNKAHKFDRYLDALTIAERYAGTVMEATETAQEPITGHRAPQTSHGIDNAAQPK